MASGREPAKVDKRVLRRGKRARDRLVTGNMRLVLTIARRHAPLCKHLSYFDLCQEGCIGLVKAADKFDPTRGYKFSTYSFWWIRQAIKRSIDDREKTIRIPSNMAGLLRKIRKAYESYSRSGEKPPSLEEMCDRLGIKQQHVRSALMVYSDTASLDTSADNSDGRNRSTMIDLMIDESSDAWEDAHTQLLVESLQAELCTLPHDEMALLSDHYGLDGAEPKAFQTIAKEKSVSREAVRQSVGRTHKRLRLRMMASRASI